MFALVDFAARKGLADPSAKNSLKQHARQAGVRGETYAYWYHRQHGYILIAHKFTLPGVNGEIEMIRYDRPILAFVKVKTRWATEPGQPKPEEAVDWYKRRNLVRMARQFHRVRRIESASCRIDVMVIEARPGARPEVRLQK